MYKPETYTYEFWREGEVYVVIHQQGEPLLSDAAVPEAVKQTARKSRDARKCDFVRVLVGPVEVFSERRSA